VVERIKKIGALHEKSKKSNEKKRGFGLSVQVAILHEKSVVGIIALM
jgi:hypothetical protein